MHVLSTLDDDLETKRAAMAAKLDRPVYIAGCVDTIGDLFRRPGGTKYEPIGALERYLSSWSDHGRCVKREKIDDDQSHDVYYFDLHAAEVLHLVFPITPDEMLGRSNSNDALFRDTFKAVRLACAFSPETQYPSPGERIPPELEPYLVERKTRPGVRRSGIPFRRSEPIAAPLKLHERWHRGLRVQPAVGDPFVTLQAPGWYNGQPLTTIEEVNRVAMIDMDPGRCAVCTGRSGERRHIAPLQTGGQNAYLMGHLCRVCAKDAFAQWAAMLDDEKPI